MDILDDLALSITVNTERCEVYANMKDSWSPGQQGICLSSMVNRPVFTVVPYEIRNTYINILNTGFCFGSEDLLHVIKPVSDIIQRHGLSHHTYADDTQ